MSALFPDFPNEIPNIGSDSQVWADFLEYISFFNGHCTMADFLRPVFRSSDELEVSGIDGDEDKMYSLIDEISTEIRRRIDETDSNYPFELVDEDYVLVFSNDSPFSSVYKFLLYSTYLNMGTNRVHNDIDGTKVFEEFSSLIAKKYLGDNTSGGVFGTALEGGFREKLARVIHEMGEGGGLKNPQGARPQDEDIDIIVWKPFKDVRRSKLICFGQCKTGLSWEKDYIRLRAKSITDIWFVDPPTVDPVLLFFCSKYFSLERWDYNAKKKELGIVFDRFRIMSLLDEINIEENQLLIEKINNWVNGVEVWLNANSDDSAA